MTEAVPNATLICEASGLQTGFVAAVKLITGGVLSMILVVVGDSIHPGMMLAVPAGMVPHAALVTYLVLIRYPLQLSAVGGVLLPHVTPLSKLY